MHGQQTMKYLNDKAVADAIMAANGKSPEVSPQLEAAYKELMVERAKAKAEAK